MDAARDQVFERATFARITWRIIPLLFAGYVAAFLDRVNVGFAKLQMASDLHFSDAVYGFGAGIFFIGYFVLDVPSNLALNKVGARIWMSRIMFTWGLVSAGFVFLGAMRWGPIAASFGCSDAQFTFYVLRFLLGAAEAGFFPGVILYLTFWFPADRRARMVALFMSGPGAHGQRRQQHGRILGPRRVCAGRYRDHADVAGGAATECRRCHRTGVAVSRLNPLARVRL